MQPFSTVPSRFNPSPSLFLSFGRVVTPPFVLAAA
jgi:hypothetical protein